MPLLQFKCNACEKVFDELVAPGKADQVACPACGSRDISRHYQGKCYFGKKCGDSGCSGGNCACCKGCGH